MNSNISSQSQRKEKKHIRKVYWIIIGSTYNCNEQKHNEIFHDLGVIKDLIKQSKLVETNQFLEDESHDEKAKKRDDEDEEDEVAKIENQIHQKK